MDKKEVMPMGVLFVPIIILAAYTRRGSRMRIKPRWDKCYELKSLSQMDIIVYGH